MIKINDTEISGLYIGSTEATKAYLGSTLIYSKGLPNVPYLCNYNAKNFNPNTQTFVRSNNNQLFASDLTNNAGITGTTYSVSGGCVSMDGNFNFQYNFGQETDNPFNIEETSPETTIIYKAAFVDNSRCLMTNREQGSNPNYQIFKSAFGTSQSDFLYIMIPDNQVATVMIRINGQGVAEKKWFEGNRTKTETMYIANSSPYISFFGDIGTDFFIGDFYWLYMSRNYLTDAQVAEVIAYNG